MISALTPAAEGPAPMYNGAPPDAQPMDLEGALAMADSIIWRDNGMDQREQALFTAWVQKTILRAQAQQAAMQQGGQMGGGQEAGLGSSGASDYDPFGATGDSGEYD
jgi:hypothetical protein